MLREENSSKRRLTVNRRLKIYGKKPTVTSEPRDCHPTPGLEYYIFRTTNTLKIRGKK